jgi:DNA recombination-dependent growth factor C
MPSKSTNPAQVDVQLESLIVDWIVPQLVAAFFSESQQQQLRCNLDDSSKVNHQQRNDGPSDTVQALPHTPTEPVAS